jgi:MFS family permease
MRILQQGKLGSNITKMYLFKILSGVVFFAPIMMLFKEANGVSQSEIFYLQIAFAMSMVLFEIPTGYFADIYGRKASMVAGSMLQVIGILAFSVAYGFWSFMVVEIVMGLGLALYSGANSALVYETLKEQNQELEYKKVWGDMQFYNIMMVGLSSVFGSLIADGFSMRHTIYASVPFYFLMVWVALSFSEPKWAEVELKKGYGKEFMKNVKERLLENQALKWIIIYSGLVLAFNQSVYPMYQNYFELIKLDLVYFGLVFASFQVVSAFSSKFAHKAEELVGKRDILIALPFVVGVSYWLMGTYLVVWGFLFVFLQQFVRGFRMVVINDYINNLVESEHRATILSVESLFSKLMLSFMLLVWGVSLDFISLAETLQWIGVFGLLAGVVIWFFIVVRKVIYKKSYLRGGDEKV